MKQVQIYGTDGDRYRTSDGLKYPIGNAEHRVNSWAWCDGEFLMGGQQASSRVPYVPSGVEGIILACPICRPGSPDPYNPYDGNQDTWISSYEVFYKNKNVEYPGTRVILKTHYSPLRFITAGKDQHFLVMSNGSLSNYSIVDLNKNKMAYDKIGDFDDGVVNNAGELYWFHVNHDSDSVGLLQMLKNGSPIKTFVNDLMGGSLAKAAMNKFVDGLEMGADVEDRDSQELRDYFLKDQIPKAWLEAGLKPGRVCYGLEKVTQSWGDELCAYKNTQTTYALPPGPGWEKIATYWIHCKLTTPDTNRPSCHVNVVVGSIAKSEGQTNGKFGADESEFLISKRCVSGLGIRYILEHEGIPMKELGTGEDVKIIPFWISDEKCTTVNEKGDIILDTIKVIEHEINDVGTRNLFVVDMSKFTDRPSFGVYTIEASKAMVIGWHGATEEKQYDFNKYGYKIQSNVAFYKSLRVGVIPVGCEPYDLVYHDSQNMYFLNGSTVTAVNRSTGAKAANDLPQRPVQGRWFKNKKAERVVKGLISDV